jgi:hypothetical protein
VITPLILALLLAPPPAKPAPPMYAAQRGEARVDISTNAYGFAPGVPKAPKIGEVAPEIALASSQGGQFKLSDMLVSRGGARYAIVVFFRGTW